MLIFELFPAFMAMVAVVVGLLLYRADRQGRRNDDPYPRPLPPPPVPDHVERPTGPRRPSMSA